MLPHEKGYVKVRYGIRIQEGCPELSRILLKMRKNVYRYFIPFLFCTLILQESYSLDSNNYGPESSNGFQSIC